MDEPAEEVLVVFVEELNLPVGKHDWPLVLAPWAMLRE
jgi:hypothetical protein